MRLSPLQKIHQESGVALVAQKGWLLPEIDVSDEHSPQGVRLKDASASGKIEVAGVGTPEVLAQVLGAAPSFGHFIVAGQVMAGSVSPDKVMLITNVGEEKILLAQLEEAITRLGSAQFFASAIDQTAGFAGIQVSGASSQIMLRKLCGLDLRDGAFPVGAIRASSLAKIRVILWRTALDGYLLHCARPYGIYLWETLVDAGAEFESL